MTKPTPTLQPRCDSPDVVPGSPPHNLSDKLSDNVSGNFSDTFSGNLRENLPAAGTLVPAVEISWTADTGRHLVVTLTGDVDVATAPQVRSDLLPLIHQGPPVVVVDLSAVPFLDSTGLGTLLAVQRRAEALDVTLRLAAPARGPRRALHITGLDRVFDVYPTLDDALRSAPTRTEPADA
ncbi:anti-anti-sigma factor [Actinopolymorpha cephalotaxi]|uniref:Anti-sigma factor antagonist n=1 Tax=Actinopolymorpha cephalotaxi TaxID=504797 RepID=A0A1I2LIU3_9ACTN|nr:STAS domain-containing protein [Actinopolymorpha cephalotaxi]NYH84887.1 anti-anti-sigma factor [Actinopolymorpha cephalotaxi]SFF78478.1 anti-anti-sigma factor [Actinopolymorpha cephalotaxi]